MATFSRLSNLHSLLWQSLRMGYVTALLSLILWSNTILAANSQQESVKVSLTPVTLSIPLPEQQRIEEKDPFVLNLEGVEYDPRNVVPYDIYLNLPSGVTPNPNSPYYAGKVALYAYPQGATYSLNVTDVVRRLKNSHLLEHGKLSVTIVPPLPKQFVTSAQGSGILPPSSDPVIRFKHLSISRHVISE